MAEYINKQALLAEYDRVHVGPPGGARKLIEEAPAADVVPVVHGRWINKTNHNRAVVEQRVDCSACGHILWHTSAMSYNYCPNCGARMDGE